MDDLVVARGLVNYSYLVILFTGICTGSDVLDSLVRTGFDAIYHRSDEFWHRICSDKWVSLEYVTTELLISLCFFNAKCLNAVYVEIHCWNATAIVRLFITNVVHSKRETETKDKQKSLESFITY